MFTVHWSPSAIANLAELWTSADESIRQEITDAAREIDRILVSDALDAGESRDEGYRILMASPLGIEYVAEVSLGVAYVHRVWRFKTRNRP